MIDCRVSGHTKRRRRKCKSCDERYTTYEIVDGDVGSLLEQAEMLDSMLDLLSLALENRTQGKGKRKKYKPLRRSQ